MASGRFFLRWTWADGFVENDEVGAGFFGPVLAVRLRKTKTLKPSGKQKLSEDDFRDLDMLISFWSMVVSQITGKLEDTHSKNWVDGGFFSFHRFSMTFPNKSLRGPGSAHAN